MKRKIIGFDKDDAGDWRAELDCGHFQHVRHKPPLVAREWVLKRGANLESGLNSIVKNAAKKISEQ
ncbi:MAG: DUF3565 domain-containing protein [Pyrinomonadaceae bacterium]|nr:DUF3565 domain-containing protein [Pyrinomonadaceae bacterium]